LLRSKVNPLPLQEGSELTPPEDFPARARLRSSHRFDTSNPRALYEDGSCRRGQVENHIKSRKTHLAADRNSCTKATANQLRLFLHAVAYWIMAGLRVSMPKRSMWRVAWLWLSSIGCDFRCGSTRAVGASFERVR